MHLPRSPKLDTDFDSDEKNFLYICQYFGTDILLDG